MNAVASRPVVSRRDLFRAAGAAGIGLSLLPRELRADDRVADSPAVSGAYRFKIGTIEAVSFSDGHARMSPVHPLFAPEATKEELDAVLAENFQPTDHIDFAFNVLALKTGSDVVLIDTGNGPGGPTTGKLAERLAAAGISASSVTGVIISHAHPDHLFGAVDASDQPVFPNARVFVNKVEHDFWTTNPDLSGIKMPDEVKKVWTSGAQRVFKAISSKLELVKPGDRTFNGLELVGTSGHTPGHLSVAITSGTEGLFATGDLAHNSVVMFARPEWTVAFDADPKLAVESRKKQFDRIASERLRVYGYHMPWPGVGHIRRDARGYEWVPEAWSWDAN